MESSNHSAEVISLGKKIVEELKLTYSVNTLGRWMAHYISGLILKAEAEPSEAKRKKTEKECCEMILKIWANRRNMPDNLRPLSNLSNALSVLNSLKRRKKDIDPWRRHIHQDHNPWGIFISQTVNNYDEIIGLTLAANIAKEALEKEKEWLNHKELLSDEEREVIQLLDSLIEQEEYFKIKSVFDAEEKPDEEKEDVNRINKVLEKLSSLSAHQMKLIEDLKKRLSAQKGEEGDLDQEY